MLVRLIVRDRFHPNREGHGVVSEAVQKEVEADALLDRERFNNGEVIPRETILAVWYGWVNRMLGDPGRVWRSAGIPQHRNPRNESPIRSTRPCRCPENSSP